MNRARIIREALPLRIRRPGSDWRACDAAVGAVIDDALHVLRGNHATGDVAWYKQTEKKWIFRLPSGDVVKAMHLKPLSLRLKYRRYARDEAANLVQAALHGVRVPQVYAVGAIRGRIGLVATAVLIIGELAGMRTATELIEEANGQPDHIAVILSATLPAFERLYECGCNHIDLHAGNILLDPNDFQTAPAVIDFKYALFHPQPSLEVLMMEAGRFAGECAIRVSRDPIGVWFEWLLDRVGVVDARSRDWCRQRFEYYSTTQLSRKDRRRVNPLLSPASIHSGA